MDDCFMSPHHRQKSKKSKKTFDRIRSFFTLIFYLRLFHIRMNTIEPEWWSRPKEVITNIRVQDNAGNPWPVELIHNGKKYNIPKKWISLHINGWAVRIQWIDITSQVQKWVENIFQHDSWKWSLRRIEIIDSGNTPLPHPEWSPES